MQLTRRLRSSSLPRWAATLAWMTLIFYLSAQRSLPTLSDRFGSLQSIAGHLVEYAILALLLQWALRGNPSRAKEFGLSRGAGWAFVIALTYGITDELHQHFVPGRTMDPFDLLMDAVGAAAALLILSLAIGHRFRATLLDERRPTDLP